MKLKKQIGTALLIMTAVFMMTACGAQEAETSNQGAEGGNADAGRQEQKLADGSAASDAWKSGMIQVNGTVYTLSETTLEQFCASGYQSDEQNDILSVETYRRVKMSDGKHQEIDVRCSNFSNEKPLYVKHAIITGYRIDLRVGNGLEAVDVVFPGNIKGGMSKDEIVAIMGAPDSDSSEDVLHYDYEENEKTLYRLTLNLDSSSHTLEEVDYTNEQEYANKSEDSTEIEGSLDTTVETAKLSKTKVSDSLKDAEIKIGKQVYAMPLNAQDLVEIGYDSRDGELQKVLNPGQVGGSGYLRDKGNNYFYVDEFENLSDQPRALSHCWISELIFTKEAESVSIAKGIKIGSSYKEVISAFGKVEKSDYSSYYWLSYSYSAKRGQVRVDLNLNKKTDKVQRIDMTVSQLK